MSEKRYRRVGWIVLDETNKYLPELFRTKQEAVTNRKGATEQTTLDRTKFVVKPVFVEV